MNMVYSEAISSSIHFRQINELVYGKQVSLKKKNTKKTKDAIQNLLSQYTQQNTDKH